MQDSSGRVLCCGHYFPVNSIAVRVLTFGKVDSERDAVLQALQSAIALRRVMGLFDAPATNAFRLVHGEADSLPGLIVDLYGRCVVMQCHSSGMYRLRQEIADILRTLLKDLVDTIYVTKVQPVGMRTVAPEGSNKTGAGDEAPEAADAGEYLYGSCPSSQFLENGISFTANWEKGQKTGFFLDQRDNRRLVSTLAAGRVVLDAFCYSGGFTISALRGGAKETHSVDASSSAIASLQGHLDQNGYGPNSTLYTEDCFNFLSNMGGQFDMIVLDPPAFVKHQKALQRGLRGYETINYLAIEKIKKGGLLFTYSCSQLVSKEEFRKHLFLAAVKAKRSVRVLSELEQAACHPVSLFHREGSYLKGLLLYVE